MFWSNFSGGIITVTIDGGVSSGQITKYYNQTTPPDCGSAGCYNVIVSIGTHTYSATDGTYNWSGNFQGSGTCSTFLLY